MSNNSNQQVKEQLGHDSSKDKGLLSSSNDPREMNLAAAKLKEAILPGKSAEQPALSSTSKTEGLWRGDELIESEKLKEVVN